MISNGCNCETNFFVFNPGIFPWGAWNTLQTPKAPGDRDWTRDSGEFVKTRYQLQNQIKIENHVTMDKEVEA